MTSCGSIDMKMSDCRQPSVSQRTPPQCPQNETDPRKANYHWPLSSSRSQLPQLGFSRSFGLGSELSLKPMWPGLNIHFIGDFCSSWCQVILAAKSYYCHWGQGLCIRMLSVPFYCFLYSYFVKCFGALVLEGEPYNRKLKNCTGLLQP